MFRHIQGCWYLNFLGGNSCNCSSYNKNCSDHPSYNYVYMYAIVSQFNLTFLWKNLATLKIKGGGVNRGMQIGQSMANSIQICNPCQILCQICWSVIIFAQIRIFWSSVNHKSKLNWPQLHECFVVKLEYGKESPNASFWIKTQFKMVLELWWKAGKAILNYSDSVIQYVCLQLFKDLWNYITLLPYCNRTNSLLTFNAIFSIGLSFNLFFMALLLHVCLSWGVRVLLLCFIHVLGWDKQW